MSSYPQIVIYLLLSFLDVGPLLGNNKSLEQSFKELCFVHTICGNIEILGRQDALQFMHISLKSISKVAYGICSIGSALNVA